MAKTILLAEDSEDDEELFKVVLKKSRVENPVIVVHDGAETISYLEGQGPFADRARHPFPGILVLDLKMPRVDGFAVLEWLAKNPSIKNQLLIIVLTHLDDLNQIRRAYELGAHSFLPKPFTPEDLKNLILHFDGRWEQSEPPAGETH